MSFKIQVEDDVFEWLNGKLECSSDSRMNELKELLELHIPTVVIPPGQVDYDNDLSDGPNAYYAIKGIFQKPKVLIEPTEDFLFEYFDDDVIY